MPLPSQLTRGAGFLPVWLLLLNLQAAWKVTSRDLSDPVSVAVGEFARNQLPQNAVLLCEVYRGDEHLALAVEGYKVTDKGVEIKTASRLKAWENLAELLGMKKLQVEVTHPLDGLLTEEERAQLAQALGVALGTK